MPDSAAAARILERRMRVFAVLQTAQVALLLWCPYRGVEVAGAVLFALYRSRTLWTVVHDRVHQPILPWTPARLYYDVATGFIAQFWRKHHLAHHAYTNTDRDPDLRLFFGRVLGRAQAPGSRGRGLRWLGTVAQFPLVFLLFFLRSISGHPWRMGVAYVGGLLLWASLMRWCLTPEDALLNTACNMGLGSVYILFTFAPTHSASEENFALRGDREADAILATNDVWPHSRLWSWLCGGINLHIEHHLFPNVPSQELHRWVPLVEDFARERGLPYHATTPWSLWRAHLGFLWRTS